MIVHFFEYSVSSIRYVFHVIHFTCVLLSIRVVLCVLIVRDLWYQTDAIDESQKLVAVTFECRNVLEKSYG